MKKTEIDILSYVRAIGISLAIAIVFSCALIYFAQLDVINHSSSRYNEKILKDYIKNTVIVQNEDLEMQYPDDYRIDIHLGYLNKVIGDYEKAEVYYKRSIDKAPYNCYRPYFELARFYVYTQRYDDAESIMTNLPDKANPALIKYKAELFRLLGDAYYNMGKYDTAIDKYNIAVFYQNRLEKPQKDVIKQINAQIFICNIKQADIEVNNNDIPNAVKHLKAAENYNSKNFDLRYKIALANADYNPELSYKYFSKLFKEAPDKIDYRAYYNVLVNLSDMYYDEGDEVKSELFDFKAKDLLNYVESNIIYSNDVIFKLTDKKLYRVNRRYKILLTFKLQNCSTIPLKNLSITVRYKKGNKLIEEYTKKIVSKNSLLASGDTIPAMTLFPNKTTWLTQKDIPKLTAEIYLFKSTTNKICVFNGQIFHIIPKN